jgi:hypothetical protein
MLEGDDPDGIELRFTASSGLAKTNDIEDLCRLVEKTEANSESNVELAIDKAIDAYASNLQKPEARPLTIYVLTDGNWDYGEPEVVLLRLGDLLDKHGLERDALGIQFISFGKNAKGLHRLKLLDDMHKQDSFDLKL